MESGEPHSSQVSLGVDAEEILDRLTGRQLPAGNKTDVVQEKLDPISHYAPRGSVNHAH